ncbi:MAG: DUF1194 domain-containing protein [Hyphomicrobiales bacterium]
MQKRPTIRPWFALCASALILLIALLDQGERTARAQSRLPVDLLLVLSIDCSYSVDKMEFDLQAKGTAWAFTQPEVKDAIQRGPYKRIAVAVVQWAGADKQHVAVPWRVVASDADADALAQEIAYMPRFLAQGSTSIAGMMHYGRSMLLEAPFAPLRLTLDIAADGRNNTGGNMRPLRDALVNEGITVNGLAILNEVPTLNHYFQREIIGGVGSFVIVAKNYDNFQQAIYRKLLREIIGPGIT